MTPETKEAHLQCVGPGWRPLVEPLLDYCIKHNLQVYQVKEKFGALRFYSEGDETLREMARNAEQASAITCEECGQPGAITTHTGWIKISCPKHHYG